MRKAVKTGDILIDLITTTQMEYSLDALADELKALDLKGHITGFLHTYNDSVADAIKNERTEIVFGQDFFYEELLGLTFRITPFSFSRPILLERKSSILLPESISEQRRIRLCSISTAEPVQ